MPAAQGDAGIRTGLATAVDNLLRDLGAQFVDGPTKDRDGHERFAAHRVDIANGVGGGDATKLKGVIHDGHEKVGRRDNGLTIA